MSKREWLEENGPGVAFWCVLIGFIFMDMVESSIFVGLA